MKLLAIDTATENCSVALGWQGEVLTRGELLGRGHAERVLPMVQSLLAEAGIALTQLDAIAFGRGPGAFTGVRIAISIVQGLALGADLPVVPVSDLAALALQALRQSSATRALACLDARMGEVYWGEYVRADTTLVELVGVEQVIAPQRLLAAQALSPVASTAWLGAGHGWQRYPELAQQWPSAAVASFPDMLPRAEEVLFLAAPAFAAGHRFDAAAAAPVYLRDQVAWVGARPAAG